jgi:RNA polymerase sigma-70 factor, ECF subfamily
MLGNPLELHVKPPDDYQRDAKNREFVRLLAEHDRQLSAYVHTVIPLWQDAEDVLQNAKLRLWEQFDSFQAGTDFAGWAFTVAGYMVRTYRKRCQRQRVCFNDELLARITRDMSTPSVSMQEDYLPILVECVKALSSASRRLLRRFCVGNQQIKDIARELGQSAPATRMALLRVRRSLFDCVQKRLHKDNMR